MTIYAVSEPGGTLVKIGHAGELRNRVRGLMSGCPVPLTLRAHWDGDTAAEKRLHRHFADRRRHGEWFEFGGQDPVALISSVLGRGPQPPADLTPTTRSTKRSRPTPTRIPEWAWDALSGVPR